MTAKYVPAIASQSLGTARYHTLETKLAACAQHGFQAIELFYEDLEATAHSQPPACPPQPAGTTFSSSTQWDEQLLAAATYIHSLCTSHNLHILCLQPFMQYEGLTDASEHAQRLSKLDLWFQLADRLHTDLIQIPSNFLPESQCTASRATVVSDLREVADRGLAHTPHPIRFAYEALCWGTHVDLWDQAWEIVQAVDRPNLGTCLDTFNICGRVWADPASPTGTTPHADDAMRRSLAKLAEIDVAKIFYVEVVDAERLLAPLTPGHAWWSETQKPRMAWSRNARLFPFEERGYLPILQTLRVITETVGYTGYVSFELFSRTCNGDGPEVPEEHATRGARSWARLVRFMGWNAEDGDGPEVGVGELKRQDSGVDIRVVGGC